ncbi:polyadenylated RNA binding protein [Scheffersomyces xylosifermentans]|uniref:polyadenylated RNA binding protein n=1 Tax=Scheffersomyces xylosifermentans TaxID=1304137 RepID=UPI00315D610C
MVVSFNPDGPVGIELKNNLVGEIRRRFSTAENDASDIAEYIGVLIASGKQPGEIASEVNDIVDIVIDVPFVESVIQEIERLEAIHASGSVSAPPPPAIDTQMGGEPVDRSSIPTGPKGTSFTPNFQARNRDFGTNNGNRGGFKAGGIGKQGGVHKTLNKNDKFNKRPLQNQQVRNLERALDFAAGNNPAVTKVLPSGFVPKAAKGRCPDFPYCKNKDCDKAHPTRNCFAYPNCPNPPGTCNYLHPDQDQDLIAKLEVSKKEYEEKKKNEILVQQATCKFGPKCAKCNCPFAHPTPANMSAKITSLEWCPSGKGCQDTQCSKAHPPPPTATVAPKETVPGTTSHQDIALEQCKFGANCTNYNCPRRHAKSAVACREGANCKRYDCTFAHPLNEVCRFGEKCSNKFCMFQHPNGRNLQSNTWTSDQATSTNSQVYAVPEDQVMDSIGRGDRT